MDTNQIPPYIGIPLAVFLIAAVLMLLALAVTLWRDRRLQ